jgi:hypothetical protein
MKLNVRAAFKMVGQRITQEWAIDATNITNRRNIFSEDFNVNTGNYDVTYQTGFLPIVQYKIYF